MWLDRSMRGIWQMMMTAPARSRVGRGKSSRADKWMEEGYAWQEGGKGGCEVEEGDDRR